MKTDSKTLERNRRFRSRLKKSGMCQSCCKYPTAIRRPFCQQCAGRRKDFYRKRHLRIKSEVLSNYSSSTEPSCSCCGEGLLEMLTIDHLRQDGAQRRKNGEGSGAKLYEKLRRENYPPGYRVLCFNCNSAAYWNGGVCPHETKG